jgi:hypothetical protein
VAPITPLTVEAEIARDSLRWRRRRAVALAVCAVLVAFATAALPQGASAALDANCPGPSDDTDTHGDGINPARVGQTFTALNTGALVRIEIEVNKAAVASSDWVVQIVATDGAGVPTNTVLASGSVPDSSVPSGQSRLAAEINPGAVVEAGQRYAFVLARPGGGSFGVRERTGNPCPVQEFESPSQTGAWAPAGDAPMEDIVFATFVEPDCDSDGFGDETQDPSLFGGSCPARGRSVTLDANKNKIKKGKKVRLTGQVNATARQGPCETGQTVELQRKRPKQTTFTTFAQVQTDAQGSFSLKKKVKKTFEFRAQVVETAACTAALSNSEKVKVKKKK